MQHNCAINNCNVVNTSKVFQERIETHTLAPNVQHHNSESVVLNTAQMHSHQFIQSFHTEANPINRQNAIHAGAAREIAAQRVKNKGKVPDAASASSMLQNVLNPLNTAGKGKGRA